MATAAAFVPPASTGRNPARSSTDAEVVHRREQRARPARHRSEPGEGDEPVERPAGRVAHPRDRHLPAVARATDRPRTSASRWSTPITRCPSSRKRAAVAAPIPDADPVTQIVPIRYSSPSTPAARSAAILSASYPSSVASTDVGVLARPGCGREIHHVLARDLQRERQLVGHELRRRIPRETMPGTAGRP